MEKLFVPHELAKLLKEKGFNEPCAAEYYKEEFEFSNIEDPYTNSSPNNFDKTNVCSAPLYSQVTDWLREEKKIFIGIELDQTSTMKYDYRVVHWTGFAEFENINLDPENWGLYRTYYEALHAAIIESLKLL